MFTDIPENLFKAVFYLGKVQQSIEEAPYEMAEVLKHISDDDVRRVKEQIAEVRKRFGLTVI